MARYVALVLLMAFVGCSSGDDPDTPRSPAFKLSAIDGHDPSGEDDAVVQAYNAGLDDLETKCPEDREEIAAAVVDGREKLAGTDSEESALELLEFLGGTVPPGRDAGPCVDILRAYVSAQTGH